MKRLYGGHRAEYRYRKIKRLYGISEDEYLALCEMQGGRCAICDKAVPVLAVDHCHETGAVRGLLCSFCNTGIGHLGDDPDILERAKQYLLTGGATAAQRSDIP